MAVYKYRARDQQGKIREAIVKSENRDMAVAHVRELGFILISMKEIKDKAKAGDVKLFGGGVKYKDIAMFTTQLHTLLIAGLPVVSALKALENSTSNIAFQKVLREIRENVEGGNALAESFAKHKKLFDELYCNMVKAGEASGTLAEVLNRLAFSIEKEQEVKKRIRQAMSYPMVLLGTMITAILVLGGFVIPRFAKLFESLNADLPLPTKILLGFNYFLTHYWFVVFSVVAVLTFAFFKFINTKAGRFLWDRFKLRVFIFGPLFLKIYMARFSYMVSTLIQSGISVIDTFDLAGRTLDNTVIAKAIGNIRDKITQGRGIASAMKEESLFPELVIQMVAVGEEAGRIEDLLDQVGHFYEKEADYTIANMTTLIEPLLLFFMAGIVLVMALGIFLPLWNMHSAMTGQH